MIIYNGIKNVSKKVSLLCFINDHNAMVEIPIDKMVATQITNHLSRLVSSSNSTAETETESHEDELGS